MTKKEKLQQIEFACESLLETIPRDTCKGCPFVDESTEHCGLNKSRFTVLRDYCIITLAENILKEARER